MKSVTAALVVASLLAAAVPCMAEAAKQPMNLQYRHGTYLFGGIGGTSVSASSVKPSLPGGKKLGKLDASAFGYALGAGYRFGDHFALEASYRGMLRGVNVPMLPAADGKAQNKKFRTQGAQLSALGIIPLGQRFEMFGKASLGYMQNKFGPMPRQLEPAVRGSKPAARSKRPSSDLSEGALVASLGFGASYYVNDRLAIRGEITGLSDVGKKMERAAGRKRLGAGQTTLSLVYQLE